MFCLSSLVLLLFMTLIVCEPVAYFSGPAYISYNITNKTDVHKFQLVFQSPLKYGLLSAWFGSSERDVFRLYLDNGTLMYDLLRDNNQIEIFKLTNNYQKDGWNNITLNHEAEIFSISFNSEQTSYFPLHRKIDFDFYKIYIGGIDNSISSFTYNQFFGHVRTLLFDDVHLIDGVKTNSVKHHNIVFQEETSDQISLDKHNQTVTINQTNINFPITATSFSNFSLSFDFKSPDNTLLLLSYHMRQFFFSLRKDANQLILELNLHGDMQNLAVDLTSANEWVSIKIAVNNARTSLSADDRNSEVKSGSPIANKRFNKQPITFGWNLKSKMGFRGCLRNFIIDNAHLSLYDMTAPIKSTLIGCWYPTPSCADLSCPYSCKQSWELTTCVSVPVVPEIAEFSGFGIIQMTVPSLAQDIISRDPRNFNTEDQGISIKLNFVSTSTSADDVLLNLGRLDDNKPFITLQMLEGFIMFSFALEEDDINLNTDTPLNDGKLHSVSLYFTKENISFQVDERIKRQKYNVDMSVFDDVTNIKIGGSSLKINSYGFSGCLSNIMINDKDLLLYTVTERSSVVLRDVILNQCSLLTYANTTTVTPPAQQQYTNNHGNLPSSPPRTHIQNGSVSKNGTLDYNMITKVQRNNNNHNTSIGPVVRTQEKKQDEQLLIGLLLGVITMLAIFVFLLYFLWQKRQMHQAVKERARKLSEDLELDEDFVNKTYNPKKQDKYTLFTPHALSVIDEESESEELMSPGNIYIKL